VNFATELLKPNCAKEFLDDFLPFQKKIAFFGVFNSLSQTLIKITSIGVPDFYQGTELWDLNLVDPDNRRPVNFKRRQKLLAEIAEAPPLKAVTFLEQPQQGKIKLYETYKALEARKSAGELFTDGTYISLKVKGAYSNQIVAFCRRKGTKFAVTVVPRFLVGLPTRQSGFSGFDWKDTAVLLPPEAPREWRNAFTGEHHLSRETILAGELFKAFPTALLLSGEA
jgi:(1->4)-alpha-D-glucan 1-alpha-D-glucosylmutase